MSDFLPASPDTIAETPPVPGRSLPPVARWKADAALLLVTLIWGTTFVVVQRALADVSTLVFLSLRFALAGIVLAFLARGSRPGRRLLIASLAAGALLFAGYLLQTWGLLFTTPSKSAFITGFAVVLVPVFTAIIYRRFAGWAPALGVLAALAGLYLLTAPSGGAAINRGDLLTLGGAVAFALHIILIGHYSRLLPARALAAGQVVVACLFASASVPWVEPVRLRFSWPLLLAVVVCALLATAFAFRVQTWAQQFTTPTHTALIFTTEPMFASVTSWMVVGERLTPAGWTGGALILAGILLAELLGSRE